MTVKPFRDDSVKTAKEAFKEFKDRLDADSEARLEQGDTSGWTDEFINSTLEETAKKWRVDKDRIKEELKAFWNNDPVVLAWESLDEDIYAAVERTNARLMEVTEAVDAPSWGPKEWEKAEGVLRGIAKEEADRDGVDFERVWDGYDRVRRASSLVLSYQGVDVPPEGF